jgi:DNA-binding transcriptional regulator YiaG
MNQDLTAPMSGEEVVAAREALGFETQEALADALGLEAKYRRDTVRSWESGRQRIPGPPRLAIRLMLKLVEIRQVVAKRQLPITNQIHEIVDGILG